MDAYDTGPFHRRCEARAAGSDAISELGDYTVRSEIFEAYRNRETLESGLSRGYAPQVLGDVSRVLGRERALRILSRTFPSHFATAECKLAIEAHKARQIKKIEAFHSGLEPGNDRNANSQGANDKDRLPLTKSFSVLIIILSAAWALTRMHILPLGEEFDSLILAFVGLTLFFAFGTLALFGSATLKLWAEGDRDWRSRANVSKAALIISLAAIPAPAASTYLTSMQEQREKAVADAKQKAQDSIEATASARKEAAWNAKSPSQKFQGCMDGDYDDHGHSINECRNYGFSYASWLRNGGVGEGAIQDLEAQPATVSRPYSETAEGRSFLYSHGITP